MSSEYESHLGDGKKEDVDLLSSAEAKADRERAREQLNADIEAFLANGGKIERVEMNVMADPPKPPQSNYGGQPI